MIKLMIIPFLLLVSCEFDHPPEELKVYTHENEPHSGNYTIVASSNPRKVIITVNELLGKGWKLEGGLAVVRQDQFSLYYAQALSKS